MPIVIGLVVGALLTFWTLFQGGTEALGLGRRALGKRCDSYRQGSDSVDGRPQFQRCGEPVSDKYHHLLHSDGPLPRDAVVLPGYSSGGSRRQGLVLLGYGIFFLLFVGGVAAFVVMSWIE